MNSKLSCNRAELWLPATSLFAPGILIFALAYVLISASSARADAPSWMHALVNVPIPAHDEKTDAVLLYSEDVLNVQSNGKIKSIERRALKILRPGGREHGTVYAHFDAETKIT